MTEPGAVGVTDEPEAPTNRPESPHRLRQWLRRPYVRAILILTLILSLVMLPLGWLIVAAMNGTGGPASPVMSSIQLTIIVLTVAAVPITAFVFAVMLYSLFGWRHVRGEQVPKDDSPAIRTNTIGVVLWTAVSSVLAVFFVAWGLVALAQITANSYGTLPANEQPQDLDPLIVNVTGQQWVWTFEYPQHDRVTSDVLYLPVDRPVYFNVTSKDVIHNFWAVELGVKIDANPGAVTQTGVTPNKVGTFNLRCAELCGMHHAYMQTRIQVMPQQDFTSWVREMGGGRTA